MLGYQQLGLYLPKPKIMIFIDAFWVSIGKYYALSEEVGS